MAVERRDPVPPGRYWVFIKREELGAWRSWLSGSAGKVKVVVSESQFTTPEGIIWATTPTGDIIKDIRGEWILFDVLSPYPWVKLGLPTIVTDPTVRSSTDVITAPAPQPIKDPVEAIRDLVVVAGIFWLASSWLSSRKR